MKKSLKFFVALQVALILTALFIIISSFGFNMYQKQLFKVIYIKDVKIGINNGSPKDITLPCSLKNLNPKTPITLTAVIVPEEDQIIYIKTAYAPAKVYTDGKLVYELGKKESYPDFMMDPATESYFIKPSVFNKEIELKMDFLSPSTRNSMTIHPPIMATFKSMFLEFVQTYKVPFVFSLVQIITGIFLTIVSIMMLFFDKRVSKILFWLGMFSLVSGMWAFGECNFTGLIIKNPSLLYLFAFIGLFTICIPLIQLTNASVGFKSSKPLYILSSFLSVSVILALFLQLWKIYPLSSSMYAFHIMTTSSLCILSLLTIYEAIKNNNLQAKRFIIPIIILTIASLIEVINYYMKFTYKFASIFQCGVVIFILIMGFTIGFYIKDFAGLRKQNEKLAFEIGLMEIQKEEQMKYNKLIANNEKMLKKQRHDLRHHIIAIRELAESKNEKLKDYLDTLSKNIPDIHINYCENIAVNAVISHYATICKQENIDFSTKLIVPEMPKTSISSDLAIIFGNLLENAIEACIKIDIPDRFIRINSGLNYELLVITMDNSYNGHFISDGKKFRSTKRDDFGIGLSSIQSVAKKYQGDAKFEDKDGYFQSSVYMKVDLV